jgi:hypothetical protein
MSRATFSSTPGLGKKFSPSFQRNHDYPKSPLSPHYHEKEIGPFINQQLGFIIFRFADFLPRTSGNKSACQKDRNKSDSDLTGKFRTVVFIIQSGTSICDFVAAALQQARKCLPTLIIPSRPATHWHTLSSPTPSGFLLSEIHSFEPVQILQ